MRATRIFRILVAAALTVSLGACPDRTAPLVVKVVKSSDSGVGPDPLENVAFVRVRVTEVSNDELVVEHKVAVGEGKVDLSGLPSGRPLRVQVAGLSSDEWIESIGTSAPFTIPDTLDGAAPATEVAVFLRSVEKWSPVVPASDPATRTTLFLPRGGHTATLLDDGRVLIAGGFQAANKNPASWQYLPSVEVFDPVTGQLSTEYPDMEHNEGVTPRAFHTAVKLPSGQVLFSGGEATEGSPSKMVTVFNSLLFDPAVPADPWAPIVTMQRARSRHTATLEKSGRVLLHGGVEWEADNQSKYASPFEWFDSGINRFRLPAVEQGYPTRVGHGALAVSGGQFIAIVGGSKLPENSNVAELAAADSVRLYRYDPDKDQMNAVGTNTTNPLAIEPPRSWTAVAEIGHARLLALGGFTGFNASNPADLFPSEPFNGSDVLTFSPSVRRDPGVAVGPAGEGGRGHICAVTLRDGRVLAVGGRGVPDSKNPTRVESMKTTTTYSEDADGSIKGFGGSPLLDPRYLHTCTLLPDGSVLAVGGILEQGASVTTLDSIEIFVPSPD